MNCNLANSTAAISASKRRQTRRAAPACAVLFAACAISACTIIVAAAAQSAFDSDMITIQPGDARFDTPEFQDYQAVYTSSFSKTGGFTLQARKTGDGKKLSLIDIIPGAESVIVAQRQIDLKTHRAEFGVGPFFAWGSEFVVSKSGGGQYDWTRIPVGPGAPKQMTGEIANGGYISEMFSPTLASLMPMAVGTKFRVPEVYARKSDDSEFVSSEYDEYEVVRKERLKLESGFSCNCWVIQKKTWSGQTEMIWVSREAPFVYRRLRGVGTDREFASDLLGYQKLEK